MKNFKSILLLSIFFTINAPIYANLKLVVNGKSDYKIYLDKNHSGQENNAAKELQNFLFKITNIKFPVTTDMQEKVIIVGQGKHLRNDEILIKTLKNKLILSGSNPLYSVYTFLEDQLGVRFWTPTETDIPKFKNITIEDLNIRYASPFKVRETFCYNINGDYKFAVRRKSNGHFANIPKSWGGRNYILGFCHTFGKFIPKSKYFKKYPEWFALVGGVRGKGSRAYQLCLTNREMREEMLKNIILALKANPDAKTISISQNDNKFYCQCKKCQAINNKEGSQAGTLIHFVNKIGARLELKYPDLKIETLAYTYTRKAPKFVKPRKNIVIKLCSIECDFSKAINSKANQKFCNDVKEWSKISNNLAIWNYVTNFSNYLLPHPNFSNLDDDLRFFAKHNVSAVFEQGNAQSGGHVGDFIQLRSWVIAKLLWNPDLKVETLIHQFMTGYYGPAGKYLEEYINLLEKECRKANIKLGCYMSNTESWLSMPTIFKAYSLLKKAEISVKDSPKFKKRVALAALPIKFVLLERYPIVRYYNKLHQKKNKLFLNLPALIDEVIQLSRANNIKNYSEYGNFDSKECSLQQLKKIGLARLPKEYFGIPAGNIFDMQDCYFRLVWAGKWVKIVEDSKASDGYAAKFPFTHSEWALQRKIYPELLTNSSRWHLYAYVKLSKKIDKSIPVAKAGSYCAKRKVKDQRIIISSSSLTTDKYTKIDLGVHDFNRNTIIYFSPMKNNTKSSLCLDRIMLVKTNKK